MKRRAGIIGAALTGLALSAHAYTSAYTSLAVPGTHNGWSTTPSMTLQADYVWVGTQTFASAGGAFKFAANGSWTVNWGGNHSILHVPARDVGGLAQGGSDVSYTNLATGSYRFTFYESTATFDLVPLALPAPAATNVQVVGSFNGDGAATAGAMSNVSGYVWTATNVVLTTGADFFFKTKSVAGTETWGAPATKEILSLPFTGGTPSGSARYVLDGIVGGTFAYTFNLQSNLFDVLQTYTNAFSVSQVSAAGSFVAGYPPDYNLERISGSTWRSDFMVTNSGTLTLFFIGRDVSDGIGRFWGATNAAPMALPVSGYMPAFYTSNALVKATITNVVPGSYRVTFDANSGAYSVVQRFTTASGANYLTNASFETLNANLPAGWGTYHAASGELADFGAHSGARCGVLFAKTLTNDMDLGSFDQTTGVFAAMSGQTFRVAAAFRTQGAWAAESVRILVEWRTNGIAFKEDSVDVVGLGEEWQIHSLDARIPRDNVSAKVLFKYDGDPGTGYLLVDDAEARISASRFQNFDAWGSIPSFQNIKPGDWEATSGKTIYNLQSGSLTGGVMISKYVEGGGNNKAIEIFNGRTGAVDLAAGNYVLQQYDNGATNATTNIFLTGTLPGGSALVVARPATPSNYAPNAALTAVPLSLTNKALTFNGDDAIVLRSGGAAGTVLDRVGQVGTNVAGSVWSRFATDRTLHRSHGVLQGVTNHPTNSFALADWSILPKDDFSELGVHFFSLDDPNAPYIPSGYSLLLNTNAYLITPELDGGIGDIKFYARAQGALAGTALQLALETAPSLGSTNWTLVETLSIPLTTTNFTLFSSYASQPTHTVLRFRHIGDGTTNRIRLDDVFVDEAYAVRRTQNFETWTNYLGAPVGTYSIAEWTIQNAQIGGKGAASSVAAEVYPTSGFVQSPTFDGGVGTVNFWMSNLTNDLGEVIATLLTSTNDWATWTTNGTVRIAAATKVVTTNASVPIFLPVPSSVRISAVASPSPFVVDNVDVKVPSISRSLTFDDLTPNSSYLTFTKDVWSVTDTAIVSTPTVYSDYAGKMRNATITSPSFTDVGVFSFYYRQSTDSGDDTARLTVETSTNGSSWTAVATGVAPSTNVQRFTYYNANTNVRQVRVRQTVSDKRIFVDQLAVGEFEPAPTCTVTAALSPATPTPSEGFYLTASVLPNYAPDILVVTGSYALAYSSSWSNLQLVATGNGTYQSANQIPPLPAGTRIRCKASVTYAGPGAKPGTATYTTNTVYSTTNVVYVSDVERGTVWINEIFYSAHVDDYDFFEDYFHEDHEYIELCGAAGTSITNWKVELLYVSLSDVTKNGGQAKYATYTIPGGTVLGNDTNGFGFYVLGDQQLTTNYPIDLVLTNLISTNVMPDAIEVRDHIHDASGVIRLLDNYGNLVYSLSYGAYDSNSDRIPYSQQLVDNTNALSLTGAGSTYGEFSWNVTNGMTIGRANTGQSLTNVVLSLMHAWHVPDGGAQTSLQGLFTQRQPFGPAQSDPLYFHYAYTNSEYNNYSALGGRTHYHKQGAGGAWTVLAKQNDFSGNNDTNGTGYAYLRMGFITNYTYDRLDTFEYVIEAIPPAGSGQGTAWLGSDGMGASTAYETFEQATNFPFRYTFPIADVIEITKFTREATVLRMETDGNDPLDPIVNFYVRVTTNLTIPTWQWDVIVPQAVSLTNEQNYLTLTNPVGTNRFFAIQPLWP